MTAAKVKILKQFFHQVAELASDTLTAFVEVEREEKEVSIATFDGQAARPENRFVNRKEVAARLGVSVRTVSDLINEGLPTVPLGKRRVQFDCEEVLSWTKDRRIKGRGKTKLRVVS
jgi:predicted DNA-binding transcriptional regulator AlpA